MIYIIFRSPLLSVCSILNYVNIVLKYRELLHTRSLRNAFNGSTALLIGNGPSQGFLNQEELDKFQSKGGITICVNYWNCNTALSDHVPSWLVISDPFTLNNPLRPQVSNDFIAYLKLNTQITLFLPLEFKQFKRLGLSNKAYYFVDNQIYFGRFINPLFPRSYQSMTLFKALALALYAAFDTVGVIGMDNTYPRQIYIMIVIIIC